MQLKERFPVQKGLTGDAAGKAAMIVEQLAAGRIPTW